MFQYKRIFGPVVPEIQGKIIDIHPIFLAHAAKTGPSTGKPTDNGDYDSIFFSECAALFAVATRRQT
jgi:hypothetical protein